MSSAFQVSGLASGLDTQSIISQLMSVESAPLNKLKIQQTTHNSQIKAIATLKAAISSLQGAASALANRSTINAKAASTDTLSTSPTVLVPTATADAINGSFQVTVSQLATSTRITSTTPMGSVVNSSATLANAGFRYSVATGTVSINGQTITTDNTTTLDSLITSINGAGAGVTASLVADADGRANNRVQIVSNPGQSIQLGALADTSSTLRLLNLSDAPIVGYTAANTNSGVGASAGALNTSITINGVTTTITQGNAGFDSAQNAQFIADAINNTANTTVTAAAQADGSITLTQKTAGGTPVVDITAAGAGTGLVVGTTDNGTDRVVSTTSLGVTDVGATLTNSRLATPISGLDPSGNGSFTLNGVSIAYKATDSVTSVINRINASSAGVTAFYDPVQDRMRITASQTGARAMTMSDDQGNFLAAIGATTGTQQLGQNALFSIDSVNGGAQLTSSSNTVTGYVPGVSFDLKSTSATPVTVTVSQDPQSTINSVKQFVTQFNSTIKTIADLTKYDESTKTAAALNGDYSVVAMGTTLRSKVSGAALGATGKYQNLLSIGVSFGAIGSAVGTTDNLTVDEAKLSAAIADNPQSVEAVLTSFSAALGVPTGTNISAVSGTPNLHQDGTYSLTVNDATTGAASASFIGTSGQTIWSSAVTVAPGQDNYGIFPGLKVSVPSTLTAGATDTFSMSVTNRGIGVSLNDYLNSMLDPANGYFKNRESSDDTETADFNKRIADMQDRLDQKQTALQAKYAALETTMSQLQSQSSALSSQIAKLNASS
jgi:flagellar hook-associated protein 2